MLTMTFILVIMTLGLKIVYLRFLFHKADGLLAEHHELVKRPVKLPVMLALLNLHAPRNHSEKCLSWQNLWLPLPKKKELVCKELELSLARESLELSINLAVPTAKEVLLDAETNSIVNSFARHGSDKSVTRVISQSDGLANVDQREPSCAHDRLSVGVDCLSINADGATTKQY